MKYYGKLGFIRTVETSPGVWEPVTEVIYARGDVVSRAFRWDDNQTINADLDVTNQISVILTNYINGNATFLRWCEWQGIKWSITRFEWKPPRVILTLGHEYINEEGSDDRTES